MRVPYNLGIWLSGRFGRGGERIWGFQQSTATATSLHRRILTLLPDCGNGEESEQIQASLPQFFMKHLWTVLTLGSGSQGNLVEVEKEARQFQQNAATLYQTARRMPKFCTVHWPRLGSRKVFKEGSGVGCPSKPVSIRNNRNWNRN